MTTPHAFIAAQLDAEQAAAEHLLKYSPLEISSYRNNGKLRPEPITVGEYDPATTLRRVAADRRVLELHTSPRKRDAYCRECIVNYYPCPTIRAFVSRYPDAPGFREEWT